MKKCELTTQYPSWHLNPLRLTTIEMNEPQAVLDDFFQNYSLIDARHFLKEWLQESMRTGELPLLEQVHFHEHLEKLVEAASLLYQAYKINLELPISTIHSDQYSFLQG